MPASSPDRPAVLVVDDNEDVLTAIRLLLDDVVPTVHTATSPASLPTLLRERTYDAVLLDMNFSRDASSGREGLQWLENIQKDRPQRCRGHDHGLRRRGPRRARHEARRPRLYHQAVVERPADRGRRDGRPAPGRAGSPARPSAGAERGRGRRLPGPHRTERRDAVGVSDDREGGGDGRERPHPR